MASALSDEDRAILENAKRRQQEEKSIRKEQERQIQKQTLEAAASASTAADEARALAVDSQRKVDELKDLTTASDLDTKKQLLVTQLRSLNEEIRRKNINDVDAEQKFIQLKNDAAAVGLILNKGQSTTTLGFFDTKNRYLKRKTLEEISNANLDGDAINTADIMKLMQNSSNVRMVNLRNYIIKRTGREYGPDIALKAKVPAPTSAVSPKIAKIINNNSSITDVLNMIAFLITKEKDRDYMNELSIEKGAHGADGKYTSDATDTNISSAVETAGDVGTWKSSLTGKEAPFDIETYTVPSGLAPVIIPQGILKRQMDYMPNGPIELNEEEIKELFRECIRQMIYIMDNTRKVFAGWTKLFKETSGGGSRSKSKTKKKHHHNQDK